MRKNLYFANIILIAEVGLYCLIFMVMSAIAPATVLPRMTIPFLVLLSVIPMVVKYYAAPKANGNWLITVLIAGVTFTLLPWCTHMMIDMPVWKLFVASTVVFAVTDVIYTSIGKRISSGTYSRFAPLTNGLMLYLASQCLQGLL